jgi:type II secretory pathway component PulF
MPTAFAYKAATDTGHVIEGTLQADSRQAALEELRRQRLFPVDVGPVAEARTSRTRKLNRNTATALFARTIATMLSAGVPLDRAVAFASQQARHPAVNAAGSAVLHDLQNGVAFSAALTAHPSVFNSLFSAMVSAGEESGALDEAMNRLADHLDEVVELRGQIRASLLYPALMGIVTSAGIIVLLLFVIPRFAAMLTQEGGGLPFSTRMLVGLSSIVVHGWPFIVAVAIAGVLAGRSWLARAGNRAKLHAWRLQWPLYGDIEAKYITAQFTRALGMLLRSGRPVLSSLRSARIAVSNDALANRVDQAAEAVSHGQRVHTALSGVLPPLATELIAVGEETGRLDELCLRIADAYDVEVRRTLRTLVAIIEPALILLFGGIVGFVALAMLQAIYGINIGNL